MKYLPSCHQFTCKLGSLWLCINWVQCPSTWKLVIFLQKEYFTGSIASSTKAFGKMARDQRVDFYILFLYIRKLAVWILVLFPSNIPYTAHRQTARMGCLFNQITLFPIVTVGFSKSNVYIKKKKKKIWKLKDSKQDFWNYHRVVFFKLLLIPTLQGRNFSLWIIWLRLFFFS